MAGTEKTRMSDMMGARPRKGPFRDPPKEPPEDPPEKPPKEPEEPPTPTLYDFTQNTTFHGVKYIFDGGTRFRQVLWLLVVLTASGVFIWQVGERTYDYYRYETNVDVQLVYATELPFPAITICNQNNFRTSVTVERDLYEFIDEMYSGNNVTDVSRYPLRGVDTEEFLRAAAHQITDFIDSCTWQGEPCDVAKDFVTTLTDLGVCYTFNSGEKKAPIVVKEAGSAFGLVLILNVEQYEYMRGPQNDAGIKLMLHDQGEFALVKEQGFAVAPGSHTLAGIQRTVTYNMEPPFGECNASDTRPLANCLINCRARFVAERCGCRDIYMSNDTGDGGVAADVCDMERQFLCMKTQTMEAMRQQSDCECKQLCEYEQYTPSLSYAQLSKFNIDRIVLNDPARREDVLRKFLLARELSQRRVEDVAAADERKLRDIKALIDVLWQDVDTLVPVFADDATFAEYFRILSFIGNGDTLLRQDAYAIEEKLVPLLTSLKNLENYQFMFVEKFIAALVENFVEVSPVEGSVPGLLSKGLACLADPFLFPLPEDYDDVHVYFKDHTRRKKRSHVSESPSSQDFYFADVPVYQKLRDVHDCGHYLALKQVFAKDLIARHMDLSVDQYHADMAYDTMHGFFHGFFHNASSSPEKFPKYAPCMDLLDMMKFTLFANIEVLVDALRDFAVADSALAMNAALQGLVTALEGADLEVGDFGEMCMWPYTEYLTPSGSDGVLGRNYVIDLQASYGYFPSVRVSFNNLAEYVKLIHSHMKDEVVPRLSIIDAYLAENATKFAMAESFSALELQRSLQTIEAIASDFISFSREFDQGLKSLVFHGKKAFSFVYNTSFPSIDNADFWEQKMIQHIRDTGLPKYARILDTYYAGRSLFSISEALYDALQEDYSSTIEELKLRLPREVEEMSTAILLMKEELEDYAQENKMNQAFFMENFAQIDIFYTGMSYTEITVHNAFPFISLLSEFGGFMGLLLGASCLTLIEIIDHLVTILMAHLRRAKKPVEPQKGQNLGQGQEQCQGQMHGKQAAWA